MNEFDLYLFCRATEIGRTGTASRNFVDLFERQSSIDSESYDGIKPVKFLLDFYLIKNVYR
jgi:hypothetical protein